MCKTKLDGSEVYCTGYRARDFCIDEKWVYFVENFILEGQELYNMHRMRIDSADKETIVESCTAVDYNSDYVFYVDQSGTNMYKMKFDGSEKQKLIDCNIGGLGFFKVIGDWIYFEEDGDNQGLYKVDINGNQLEKVNDYLRYYTVNIVDNWLVCLMLENESFNFIMVKVDDSYSTDNLVEKILLDIFPDSTIYKYE